MKKLLQGRYLTDIELQEVGFQSVGENVRIHESVLIVGSPLNISIGSNVKIDAYTIISATGEIIIGSYIHIAEFCFLGGGNGIVMSDFSGISQGVRIYSGSDDYSGKFMTNPTVPRKYLGGVKGNVTLERHVIIGSGSVILPKILIGEGSSVGALSLVTKNLEPWGVYFGVPVKRLTNRSKKLLELEKEMLEFLKK